MTSFLLARQVDAPNSNASLAARRGNLAGILHGRPVTEYTTGKTCHGKHARVEQALLEARSRVNYPSVDDLFSLELMLTPTTNLA